MADKGLRIVILSEDFPPYPGGIAQWAKGMADALESMGHEIQVMARYRGEYHGSITSGTDNRIIWIPGKNWRQFRTFHCRSAVLNYYAKGGRVDLLIATTWNVARGIVKLVQRRGGKVVTVVHGLEVTRKMPGVKKAWMLHTLKSSDRIVSVSQFTRDRLVSQFKIPEERLVVVANGVDTRLFYPAEPPSAIIDKLGIKNEKIILTLARVIGRKGHDRVIAAMPKVLEEVPDAKYLICGPANETYKEQLEAMIKDLKLNDRVIFVGYLAQDELNAVYNACDVYVMASREIVGLGDTEGFGITFLEANACAKPVIGGASGGVVDAIVHGETGYLVDPENTDDIAQRIISLLIEPGLAVEMGLKGRERVVAGYTWEAAAQNMMDALVSDNAI